MFLDYADLMRILRGITADVALSRPGQHRIPGSRRSPPLVTLAAGILSMYPAFGAEDTTPPELQSLRFTPEALVTATTTEVTISFAATDDDSGVIYFETAFVDPSGTIHQSASARFAPSHSAASSLTITFPRVSSSGRWRMSHVLLCDFAGNTSLLDTNTLERRGFPTALQVTSAPDTAAPRLTAFGFAPVQIDVSAKPADVKVNYTATDDLSGVTYIEFAFVSPSGSMRRGGSARLDPARSISHSLIVSFPALCEPGRWELSSVFLADVAGNTLLLTERDIAGLGFRTALEVKSIVDTASPSLTALRFAPGAIDADVSPATVKVDYTAADNLSGVRSFEVVFTSPSGSARQSGSAVFSPAAVVSNTVDVRFPQSSEHGRWVLSAVFLSDAAGNTLAVDSDGISGLGFPTALEVTGSK